MAWGNDVAQKKFKLPDKCEMCENPAQVRHHKDENPNNNTRKNIQFLCRPCHTRVHQKGIKRGPLSAETREKLSAIRKGRVSPNKGKTFSEETRRKMSIAHRGKKVHSQEWIENQKRDDLGRYAK